MDLRYDIYEKFANGGLQWRASATGIEDARTKLTELATTSPHEFFAVHLPSKETVARVNVPASKIRE
jgi:hypothetical protein